MSGNVKDVTLEELAKLQKKRANLSELPKEFVGTITNARFDHDSRSRPAIFVDIQLSDSSIATQKYTAFHLPDLIDFMKKYNIPSLQSLIGKKAKFMLKYYRAGNPRWIPVELIQ